MHWLIGKGNLRQVYPTHRSIVISARRAPARRAPDTIIVSADDDHRARRARDLSNDTRLVVAVRVTRDDNFRVGLSRIDDSVIHPGGTGCSV